METVTVDHPKFKRIEMDFDTYSHEIQEALEKGRRDGVIRFLQDLEALIVALNDSEMDFARPLGGSDIKTIMQKDFLNEFELKGPFRDFAQMLIARAVKK
jgi:hypothetical protein